MNLPLKQRPNRNRSPLAISCGEESPLNLISAFFIKTLSLADKWFIPYGLDSLTTTRERFPQIQHTKQSLHLSEFTARLAEELQ